MIVKTIVRMRCLVGYQAVQLNAKLGLITLWVALILIGGSVSSLYAAPSSTWSIQDIQARSQQIDAFIQERLNQEQAQPEPMVDEKTLLRRLYLDLIGRIPSIEETTAYVGSEDLRKRERLIDSLLSSEGHVSHEFNHWADLLRIKSRMRNLPGQPYIEWVRDAFRENLSYDQFVSQLINAKGYLWEDGATGFYFRDAGMELDHMANTFQVFLGTQVGCAQCHDHPYDSWTQKQYYQQAAYIYGVKTSDPQMNKKFRSLGNNKIRNDIDPELKATARRMVRPLRYRVFESKASLKLPDDYQYDDAKPKSKVSPHPMFGDGLAGNSNASLRKTYAHWMTSPENPRFPSVVANRYWKRLMGVGLIEQVDDMRDGADASHPELMKFLADTMVEIDFDLRVFQAILCGTETYQRASLKEERDPLKPFLFQGRPLQRMRAEQIWDSVMALVVPDLDERPGTVRVDRNFEMARHLEGKPLDEMLSTIENEKKVEDSIRSAQSKVTKMQRRLTNSQRSKRKGQIQIPGLRAELNEAKDSLAAMRAESMLIKTSPRKANDKRWQGMPAQWVRASEVQSPAPEGHFLRSFGQSDRETIDNSNDEANVPQALMLLNGPILDYLKSGRSELASALKKAETAEEKLDLLFMGFMTREPSVQEKEWLLSEWHQHGDAFMQKVAWMLLNAREFSFIQ
jgi:hypothetical protein